ncbi:cob(I)alamin adenosyltransferase [Thermosinus carboxydivorans Nor1]|uniref:Cob(I)alamin adenosyltransferase n=1 Tax=Thermosinus carboxydivorans Nor1 TaxID=401526 RepID=A1HTV5_9FIRM|nr:cob(I)yrinic acid a,c-diamide adenosyltransferase [Thermosinus carboxydivorans]EAX46532.1 cob(I)alamin adenosyltransferase [Thermosinus carboxydivorans Nor1]
MKTSLGLIQVYTGNGKGKTTASLGLALRACGHGFKVCMIQFMKNNPDYGEMKAAHLLPGFKIIPVGRNEFVNLKNPESIDIQLARDGWELAKVVLRSREYNIVILDEINVAMACGLVDTREVVSFLQEIRGETEILLTGRYAPAEIIAIADLVTEMCEVRHPYSQGLESRQGIDY